MSRKANGSHYQDFLDQRLDQFNQSLLNYVMANGLEGVVMDFFRYLVKDKDNQKQFKFVKLTNRIL